MASTNKNMSKALAEMDKLLGSTKEERAKSWAKALKYLRDNFGDLTGSHFGVSQYKKG